MDVILIPGFWLDASAWDEVVPAVAATGHTPRPITLPGLVPADREVGLRDQIDFVVNLVDATAGPVVLVGHSGGGAVAHGVVDARPDRIAKVIYVDSGPLAHGGFINDEFDAVGYGAAAGVADQHDGAGRGIHEADDEVDLIAQADLGVCRNQAGKRDGARRMAGRRDGGHHLIPR